MIGSANHAVSYLRHNGIGGLVKEVHHRWYTRHCEQKFNVATAVQTSGGLIDPKVLGIASPDAKPYGAIGYQHIFWALKRVPFPADQVVFVDCGCGKGRAVAAAATYPFKRVIGVELSAMLVQQARENLSRMKHQRAEQVEIVQMDAATFAIPGNANVIYFFNPFDGETLSKVIDNLRHSYQNHNRHMFVIFFNCDHFEARVRNLPWIQKIYRGEFYPNYNCALYEIGGDSASS